MSERILKIEDADFSSRLHGALMSLDLRDLNNLSLFKSSQIAGLRNIGETSMKELTDWMMDNNIYFLDSIVNKHEVENRYLKKIIKGLNMDISNLRDGLGKVAYYMKSIEEKISNIEL